MKKLLSLSLLVVLVLAVGLLSGCGRSGDDNAAVVDDTPLRVLMPFQGFDPNDEPVAHALREMTGFNVRYETLPAENALIVLNATLAAREEFDLIVLQAGMFNETVALGAFEPLNDWLPSHLPNVLANTDPALFHNVTLNGDVLGIPEGGTSPGFSSTVIRGRLDMFRQAGLNGMPTTIDEFYNASVFIRDELGVIPLSIWRIGNNVIVPELSSAFGVFSDWNVVDGQIRHAVETPGMLEYVTWMNHLFNTGILDGEYATLNAAMMNEKFFTGRAVSYFVAFWNEPGATSTIMEAFPDAELAFLPPLAGPDGTAGISKARGVNRVIAIPRVAPNKERSFAFINAMNTEEAFRYVFLGEEGVHWTHDGTYFNPIDPTFDDERGNASHFPVGHVSRNASTYWLQARARRNLSLYEHLLEATDVTFTVPNLFHVTTFMPPIDIFNRNITAAQEFASDSVLQFICNVRPLSEWDAFVQEWRDLYHGATLTTAINEWWAESGEEVYPLMRNVPNPVPR